MCCLFWSRACIPGRTDSCVGPSPSHQWQYNIWSRVATYSDKKIRRLRPTILPYARSNQWTFQKHQYSASLYLWSHVSYVFLVRWQWYRHNDVGKIYPTTPFWGDHELSTNSPRFGFCLFHFSGVLYSLLFDKQYTSYYFSLLKTRIVQELPRPRDQANGWCSLCHHV